MGPLYMPMESHPRLEQFLNDLRQDVLNRAGGGLNQDFREECFTETVLELLDEHNEASAVDVLRPPYRAPSTGSVPGAKVNAWCLSGDGATLDLFVVQHFDEKAVQEVGLPETRKQFGLLRGFLRRALDGFHTKMEESSDAFTAAKQIFEAKSTLTGVRLFFITDGAVRSLKIDEEPIAGIDARYVVWDLDKLSRLKVGQRSVISLDFVNDYSEFGGAIPCLQTADATGEYRTFLAYFRAGLLARIYGEHGQRLLERNVRAFLQTKGKVNRGLQKTLKDAPHRFLAYNNGLCCTAAEVRVKAESDGHAILEWASDFQIVNGGQTTASIYHALKKEKLDLRNVVVQVKLTVLSDPASVAEIVPLISLYANSQNKVNAADFSANGRFHHSLEELSRTVWSPAASGLERGSHWYYERARGSYADDKSRRLTAAQRAEWERQNPPDQKFTKTDLAKAEHAWLGLPHFVCLGAEKNFMKFAERMADGDEPVVNLDYFRRLVAKLILQRAAERVFSVKSLKGFRAQSVAYAVSWLSEHSQKRIDLGKIWENQRLPAGLQEVLPTVCEAAHQHISAQLGNPSEACKKEPCWVAFKQRKLALGSAWIAELSQTAFVDATSEDEAVMQEWELVRQWFVGDHRTIRDLELLTGKSWMANKRDHPVYSYACRNWQELRFEAGIGPKKARELVVLLAAVRA